MLSNGQIWTILIVLLFTILNYYLGKRFVTNADKLRAEREQWFYDKLHTAQLEVQLVREALSISQVSLEAIEVVIRSRVAVKCVKDAETLSRATRETIRRAVTIMTLVTELALARLPNDDQLATDVDNLKRQLDRLQTEVDL